MHLILPAAGQSTRFPNTRPKWMLTHPGGNMMVVEAIRGLNLADFESILAEPSRKVPSPWFIHS